MKDSKNDSGESIYAKSVRCVVSGVSEGRSFKDSTGQCGTTPNEIFQETVGEDKIASTGILRQKCSSWSMLAKNSARSKGSSANPNAFNDCKKLARDFTKENHEQHLPKNEGQGR